VAQSSVGSSLTIRLTVPFCCAAGGVGIVVVEAEEPPLQPARKRNAAAVALASTKRTFKVMLELLRAIQYRDVRPRLVKLGHVPHESAPGAESEKFQGQRATAEVLQGEFESHPGKENGTEGVPRLLRCRQKAAGGRTCEEKANWDDQPRCSAMRGCSIRVFSSAVRGAEPEAKGGQAQLMGILFALKHKMRGKVVARAQNVTKYFV